MNANPHTRNSNKNAAESASHAPVPLSVGGSEAVPSGALSRAARESFGDVAGLELSAMEESSIADPLGELAGDGGLDSRSMESLVGSDALDTDLIVEAGRDVFDADTEYRVAAFADTLSVEALDCVDARDVVDLCNCCGGVTSDTSLTG